MKKLMYAGAAFAALLSAPGALAADRCNAAAAGDWSAASASCEKAFAVIVVRDQSGTPQMWESYPLEQNAALVGKTTPADVEAALTAWIDQSKSPYKSTADLPEWKTGAEAPMAGEIPFELEGGIDQENYARIRKLSAPTFCYVSTLEHLSCLYMETANGQISRLGSTFLPF